MFNKDTMLQSTQKYLTLMGEQIKMARLRRGIPVRIACERANISRSTLWQIEKGNPSVSIGCYASVLHALNGLDSDLLLIAKDDALGRKLQDLGITAKKRIRR